MPLNWGEPETNGDGSSRVFPNQEKIEPIKKDGPEAPMGYY